MKKNILKINLLFVLFLFIAPLYASTLVNEAKYSPENMDFIFYADVDSIRSFLKKKGVNEDEILDLLGNSKGQTNKNHDIFNKLIKNITKVMILGETDKLQKNDELFIIAGIREYSSDISLLLKGMKSRTIAGETVYSADNKGKIYLLKTDKIIIIGSEPYLTHYLTSRKSGKIAGNQLILDHITGLKDKDVFVHIPMSTNMKKKFDGAVAKGKQLGSGLDANVFVQAIRNLQSITVSTSLYDNLSINIGFVAGNRVDGERLTMLSHFTIVGVSFIVPFADKILKSFAKKGLDLTPEQLSDFQLLIGRIETSKIKNGVSIDFRLNDEETKSFVAYINKQIKEEKIKKEKERKKHIIAEFFKSVNAGELKNVESLIPQIGDVNVRNSKGKTALHIACLSGRSKMVELLLKNGANVNIIDQSGKLSPLHEAVMSGNKLIVAFLLEKGAMKDVADNYGNTPLHLAVKSVNTGIIKLLIISGCNVNVKTLDKITPIHLAAGIGNLEIVKELIRAGEKVDVRDYYGETPADKARSKEHKDVYLYLQQYTQNKDMKI